MGELREFFLNSKVDGNNHQQTINQELHLMKKALNLL